MTEKFYFKDQNLQIVTEDKDLCLYVNSSELHAMVGVSFDNVEEALKFRDALDKAIMEN